MQNPDFVIPTERSPDLVTTTIMVTSGDNREALPASVKVASISVNCGVNRIPSAKLVIYDGEPSKQDFSVSNMNLFVPGNKIEIFAGYHSKEKPVFQGVVVRHSLRVRSQQFLLIVECKDPVYRMALVRRSRNFHDLRESEIWESILEEYDLVPDLQSTDLKRTEIVQYDITDWDFLQLRAEANGMFCVAENGVVQIKPPDFKQPPVVRPAFGISILELDIEMDGRQQFSNVKTMAWDYDSQEIASQEATEPEELTSVGNLNATDIAAAVKTGELTLHHTGRPDDLQQWADAVLLRQRLGKICGRVKFQGTADVKPGVMIELFGVGDRFKGNVLVTGVHHEIAEGNWFSHVQFGVNPERFAEAYEVHAPRAAGRFGAINGLITGIVTQVGGDPDSEGRVRVRLPMLDEGDQGIWSRVASLDAGNERGAFFRPEIGDEVIVGFLNDDPNDAVMLGMVHSKAKPTPLENDDANNLKGFISRSKIELIFDDDAKSLTVKTPGGKTFTMNDRSDQIKMEDTNGNSIEMSKDGITISASKNLTLKAAGNTIVKGRKVLINS